VRRCKVSRGLERWFLTALIVSKPFLASVNSSIDLSLLKPEYFRQIVEWCVGYFDRYGEPPGKQIESLFYSWAEKQPQEREEVVDSVREFLESLSDEYEEAKDLNVPYLRDKFAEYLSFKKLERLKDEIEYGLVEGRIQDSVQQVHQFSSVDLGRGAGVDVLRDDEAWERAFSESLDPLIEFPGDGGLFLNTALTREALIGIQGPEKRGKTWWCVEFAIRALRNRKRVAFFEIGDLSEGQLLLRFGVRFASRPLFDKNCGNIMFPQDIEFDDEGTPVSVPNEVERDSPINLRICKDARNRWFRRLGIKNSSSYLMMESCPTSSINVRGINGVLERWWHERGFIPDVIIIDYADVLGPEDKTDQVRDQVNATWKALRRLSQERRCLVIVPTQADADSYDKRTQSMKNFSEDKRKLAHVTGMLGLNQMEAEKKDAVMRLNWIVLREQNYNVKRCLAVGQCIELGRAFCCSKFQR